MPILHDENLTNLTICLGVKDSSGLRFTYTNQLRKYDAGIIQSGHIVNGVLHLIPPNDESFLSHGECSSQCLRQVKQM